MAQEKFRITDLPRMKAAGTPITMLTAYDYPFAKIFDQAGIETLLNGDSLGMAIQARIAVLDGSPNVP